MDTTLTPDIEQALLRRCLAKARKKFQGNEDQSFIRHFLKAQGFSSAAIEEYFEG
jgi:hypothetical protein